MTDTNAHEDTLKVALDSHMRVLLIDKYRMFNLFTLSMFKRPVIALYDKRASNDLDSYNISHTNVLAIPFDFEEDSIFKIKNYVEGEGKTFSDFDMIVTFLPESEQVSDNFNNARNLLASLDFIVNAYDIIPVFRVEELNSTNRVFRDMSHVVITTDSVSVSGCGCKKEKRVIVVSGNCQKHSQGIASLLTRVEIG